MRCAPSILAVAAALLAACGPAATPTPTLPVIPRVATTPSLAPTATAWARGYAEEVGVLPFDLDILSVEAGFEALESGAVEVVITLGDPPEGWFATPLASGALAVIVHPENPVREVTLDELAALFTGAIQRWNQLGGDDLAILPVLPQEGDELRAEFDARALGGRRASPFTLLAPTPEAVVEVIRGDPGAVGIVPLFRSLNEVSLVRVEGVMPSPSTISSGRYPFIVRAVATAPSEPDESVRDWLVWIQSRQAAGGT